MKKLLLLLVLLTIIVSCTMPATTVKTVDTRPSIAVEGAPEGAELYVDGLRIGMANSYNGHPNILKIEPGIHLIVIRDVSGEVIHKQEIFVESELKTIIVGH
ncbi:MAG: hypothetical protein JSU92_05335 [Deltaproteobacteria bacterium]|nr:MAG: hypothetical protein JSU92_05335 [Deltaproteobacteria bacterium]